MTDETPPPVLDSARVIEYAIVDESIPFTGAGPLYVGGTLLGRVPRLAICENLGEDLGPMLFHCDDSWAVLGVAGGQTIEEIKVRAESRYPGISSSWVQRNVSREEALAYYDRETGDMRCSFCGRRPFETTGYVEGRNQDAAICRECVAKFHAAFQSEPS
jgi:hypothetical protein